MKKYFLLIFILLLVEVNNGFAQTTLKDDSDPVVSEAKIGTTYTFQKKNIHGQWKLNVNLPKGYAGSTDKYPVVYVLHGNFYFNFAVGDLQRLADSGEMPKAIIVGVSNESNAYFSFGTKKSDQFLDFINEEVFPLVESNYRTHQDRTVLGWHYTSGFIFHALINKPEMFNNYLPASPYLGGIELSEIKFDGLNQIYNDNPSLKNSMFFGVMDNERTVKDAALGLDSLLKLADPKNLDWQFNILKPDDENVIEVSVYRLWTTGLNKLYADYKNDELAIADIDTYKAMGGMSFVKNHYVKRAEKYGGSSQIAGIWSLLRMATNANDVLVFEELIAELNGEYQDLNLNSVLSYARFYALNGKYDEAIAMYKNIDKYHPNLISVHDGMGQSYLSLGDKEEAIATYQIAIELAKVQSDSRLEELKSKLHTIDN